MRLIFFFGICAWAQVEQPSVGWMLDSAGTVRPVFGVAASVTLGDPVATDVVSMACSQGRCVTRKHPAIFAFGEDSVYVYSSGHLVRWRGGDFESLDLNVSGEILSMRVVDGVLEFAVRRDEGTWIVRDGNIAAGAIPDATGAVMLLDLGVLFAAGDETVLRRADGTEVRFPIHADSFTAMGDGYVQIRAGGSDYGLRIAQGREKLFLLPEIQ